MGNRVSDEVWRELNPSAGRLSGRTTRRLWIAFGIAMVLTVAGATTWYVGLVVPRLVWSSSNGPAAQVDEATRVLRVNITIANAGSFPATVVGAGRSGPGLELTGVEAPFPVRLGPGDQVGVVLVYRVSDCAALPHGGWPVPVVVARPWGTYTSYIQMYEGFAWQEMALTPTCHR